MLKAIMWSFFKKRKPAVASLNIPMVGDIYYHNERGKTYWVGYLHGIVADAGIEISLNTTEERAPTIEQINFLKAFPATYESVLSDLFSYLEAVLQNTDLRKSKDELATMYCLCAIEVGQSGRQFCYTLEPLDVPSRYNFFQRFVVINGWITALTP